MTDWDAMWHERDVARGELLDVSVSEECTHPSDAQKIDRKAGEIVCTNCGSVVDAILEDMFGNTLPRVGVKPPSLYRRRHHFSEQISQFCVSVRCVPDSVITKVKHSLCNTHMVTKTSIQLALQSIGQAKMIENWIEVYCLVTEMLFPQPPGEVIEWLTETFIKIETAFIRTHPPERKCILHYNYLFQRLFQIKAMPEYLKWFPLLKSKPKLKNLDNMWWEICDQTGIPKIDLPVQSESMR